MLFTVSDLVQCACYFFPRVKVNFGINLLLLHNGQIFVPRLMAEFRKDRMSQIHNIKPVDD